MRTARETNLYNPLTGLALTLIEFSSAIFEVCSLKNHSDMFKTKSQSCLDLHFSDGYG